MAVVQIRKHRPAALEVRMMDELQLRDPEAASLIRLATRAAFDAFGYPFKASVDVTLTDDGGIRAVNRAQRQIDRATDVLSFPLFEYDEDGNIIEEDMDFNPNGEMLLGDIVISLERAKEQAEEYGHSVNREIGAGPALLWLWYRLATVALL